MLKPNDILLFKLIIKSLTLEYSSRIILLRVTTRLSTIGFFLSPILAFGKLNADSVSPIEIRWTVLLIFISGFLVLSCCYLLQEKIPKQPQGFNEVFPFTEAPEKRRARISGLCSQFVYNALIVLILAAISLFINPSLVAPVLLLIPPLIVVRFWITSLKLKFHHYFLVLGATLIISVSNFNLVDVVILLFIFRLMVRCLDKALSMFGQLGHEISLIQLKADNPADL